MRDRLDLLVALGLGILGTIGISVPLVIAMIKGQDGVIYGAGASGISGLVCFLIGKIIGNRRSR